MIEKKSNSETYLSEEIIKKAADEYKEQDRLIDLYRQDLMRKIKKLEDKICDTYHRSHYKIVYKKEYGDYREFVEKVAAELRRRVEDKNKRNE